MEAPRAPWVQWVPEFAMGAISTACRAGPCKGWLVQLHPTSPTVSHLVSPPKTCPLLDPCPDPCSDPCQSPAPCCHFTPDPSSPRRCTQLGSDLRDPDCLPTLPETPQGREKRVNPKLGGGGNPRQMASPTQHNLAEVGNCLKWVRELLCQRGFHFPASNHRHGGGEDDPHLKPTTSQGPPEGTGGDGTVTAHRASSIPSATWGHRHRHLPYAGNPRGGKPQPTHPRQPPASPGARSAPNLPGAARRYLWDVGTLAERGWLPLAGAGSAHRLEGHGRWGGGG